MATLLIPFLLHLPDFQNRGVPCAANLTVPRGRVRTASLSAFGVSRYLFTRVSEPRESRLGAGQLVEGALRAMKNEIVGEVRPFPSVDALARLTIEIMKDDPDHFEAPWRSFVEDLIAEDGDRFARATAGLVGQTPRAAPPLHAMALMSELASDRSSGTATLAADAPIFIVALRLDRMVREGAGLPGATYANDILEYVVDFGDQGFKH